MTTMDVKAISWVGDMYQKFETMCVEVEETMYQDSVKYVEDQVKTVGSCVKKFYSDVMQDLLPPSSDDSVKPQNPGLHFIHYADYGIHDKSEVDVKREAVKFQSEKVRTDSYLASRLDENVDERLSSSSCNLSNLCELQSGESTGVKYLGLHVKQSGTEELNLCSKGQPEEKFLPSEIQVLKASSPEGGVGTISNPRNAVSEFALLSEDGKCKAGQGEMCNETDEIDECLPSTSIISSSSNPSIWDEFGNDDEDILKMSDGASYEQVGDEIESADVDKEAFKVSEQLGKMKLDESCVLVEKYEQFPVSHLEGKQRSYKKKIRDVFCLRKWSRSQNQEKLSAWQEDMVSSSSSESGNTNLQSNSLESGWEIL